MTSTKLIFQHAAMKDAVDRVVDELQAIRIYINNVHSGTSIHTPHQALLEISAMLQRARFRLLDSTGGD